LVKYLLDTNSFITPYRSYYNPQITPPFWNNLLSLFEKCHLYTIDKVVKEIKKGRDWYNYVLVTFEKLDSSKIIKIPKVCNTLGIPVSPLLYENRYLNLPTLSLEEIQNYKCIVLVFLK